MRPNKIEASSEPRPTEYPLQETWVLWYFKTERGVDWNDCQHFVASVATVEDFWNLYSYVTLPSKLNNGCDYSFFKQGIEPKWEDEGNKNGGRWIFNLDKRMRQSELDRIWSELLISLVGDEFGEQTEEICGVVINARPKGDKLSIWTKNKNNQEANEHIGRIFKKLINLQNTHMIYQSHEVAAKK